MWSRLSAQVAGRRGKNILYILDWLEQPRQDKNLSYWHDEPNEPTKEGPMDEWIIKTPNLKCLLFYKIDLLTDFAPLCLTDFMDWRYIHSWLVYSTQLVIVNCCPIEEGRAASKSPHYKIWLFSFYFPARSFCRYHQHSAVRLLVVSLHCSCHHPPQAPTPCVITEPAAYKYFNNEYWKKFKVCVFGPPRSKKACVQL